MMRKILSVLLLLVFFCGEQGVFGQSQQEVVRTQGCLPISRVDDKARITWYQADIDRYDTENKNLSDKTCDVLFLGSSSINMWDNIHNDLAPLKIIRRSYGGSNVRDNIYYYNTVARGYAPRKIAIYIENDIVGKDGLTVGDAYDLFRLLIQKLRGDYPAVPIYFISLKPSFARLEFLNDQRMLNKLMFDYAEQMELVEYIDIASSMFDSEGNLLNDIFLDDQLHLNLKGYEIWTRIIKPALR